MEITNPNEITEETSIEDIIASGGHRSAFMTTLAQKVFKRDDGRMVKAYTQFGFKKLGIVITAYRKGLFDFGACIREVDVGTYIYPKDTDAVLAAIDLAAEGRYDDIDLGSLGLINGDGNPVVPFLSVFPSSETPAGAAGRAAEEVDKNTPKDENLCDVEGCTNKIKARGFCSKHYKEVRAAEKEAEEEAERAEAASAEDDTPPPELPPIPPRERQIIKENEANQDMDPDVAAILTRIDQFSSTLADSLEAMHKEIKDDSSHNADALEAHIKDVYKGIDMVLEQQSELARGLQIVDSNMRQILLYFVDPNMEFTDLGDLDVVTEGQPDQVPTNFEKQPEKETPKVAPTEKGMGFKPRVINGRDDEKPKHAAHSVHDGSDAECIECKVVRAANKIGRAHV